jgi:hypothetical protein
LSCALSSFVFLLGLLITFTHSLQSGSRLLSIFSTQSLLNFFFHTKIDPYIATMKTTVIATILAAAVAASPAPIEKRAIQAVTIKGNGA